jgi:RNA polymerase sigma factor for flagellar operon FliA
MSAAAEMILPLGWSEPTLAPVIALPTAKPAFVPREAVAQHLELISMIAGRIAARLPASVELGDLVGAGTLGLLDAAEKYDPSLKVPFRSYAEIRIRGAILDALRGLDWASRSVRRRANALRDAEHELAQDLGRAPEETEIAEEMGVSLDDLQDLRAEASTRIVYLEDLIQEEASWEEGELAHSDAPSPLEEIAKKSEEKRVAAAVARLPEREREVISLSFFESWTLKEIGARLGVTESRACQLRTQGLARLQKMLSAEFGN